MIGIKRYIEKKIASEVEKAYAPAIGINSSPFSYNTSPNVYDKSIDYSARFARSDDVCACVRIIQEAATSIPLLVKKGEREQPNHYLLSLFEKPNPVQSGVEFFENIYGMLALEGECFILLERNNPISKNLVGTMWPISGTLVKFDEARDIQTYIVQNNGKTVEVNSADMVHIKLYNPYSIYRGLSPLASLLTNLDMEEGAELTNAKIFSNGAIGQTVIAVQAETPAQLKATKDALDQRLGAEYAHRPLVLYGQSVKVERLNLTPEEMQFSEMDKATTRDVAKVFRIPLQFLASEDSNVLNLPTYRKILYTDAVLPWVRRVASGLTSKLTSNGETIEPDISVIAELQDQKATTQNP